MTVRASTILPPKAVNEVNNIAGRLSGLATKQAAVFRGGTTANVVLRAVQDVRSGRNDLSGLTGTPEIVQYAKDLENDPTYEIVTEVVALIAACDAFIAAVVADFPKDAGGYLLERTATPDGTPTWRTFTGPQLESSALLLDAINAAVS